METIRKPFLDKHGEYSMKSHLYEVERTLFRESARLEKLLRKMEAMRTSMLILLGFNLLFTLIVICKLF